MADLKLPPGIDAGQRAALEDAAALMHAFEGCETRLPDGRIAPYLDMVGVPTIGWGNTSWPDGRRVSMADPPITQEEADALFGFFLAQFAGKVFALLPPGTPPKQAAACISLAYNIGAEAAGFAGSTALRRLRAGDAAGAAAAIEMWNKAGGKVVKGLQRRRRAERLVFEGAEPEAACARAAKDFP